jgi:hypothetical protein
MRVVSVSKLVLVLIMWAAPAEAQDVQELIANTNPPPRIFLDSDIGVRAELGFIPPSRDIGASFEYPLWRRLEIQGAASFSPDKKQITHDGHSFSVSGTAIVWPSWRVGVLGEVDYGRLWTSQFTEAVTSPTFGVVIRTHYEYPGRLYFRYTLPTGCVWATPSNPCTLQSKRLQGPSIRQEFQVQSHVRWGVEVGVYRFCDQSNENDPAAGRTCHWAGTELVFVRFQFKGPQRDAPY